MSMMPEYSILQEFYDEPDSGMLNENSLSTATNMTNGSSSSPYFWGIEYNIVPLSRNLDQRGNDYKHYKEISALYDKRIFPGQKVKGVSFADRKEHVGKMVAVLNRKRNPDETSAVIIIDDKTRTLVRLVPNTVEKYSDASARQNDIKARFNWQQIIRNDIVNESDEFESVRDDDEELHLSVEESAYRDEVIEEYGLSDTLIAYLDRKFTTDVYTVNYILVRSVPFSALPLMGAETSGTIISDHFRDLLRVYVRLTGQRTGEPVDGYMNRDYILKDGVNVTIRSWREVYLMCHTVKIMWRRLRWSDRYMPAGFHAYDNWNANTDNDVYRHKMAEFIESLVKRQLPEYVRRGQDVEKCFTILKPDE